MIYDTLYTIEEFGFTLRLSRLDFVSEIKNSALEGYELKISVGGVVQLFYAVDESSKDPTALKKLSTVRKNLMAAMAEFFDKNEVKE